MRDQLRLVLRLSTTFLTRVPQTERSQRWCLNWCWLAHWTVPPDHFWNKLPGTQNLNTLRKVLRDLTQRAFRGNTQPDDVDRLLTLSLPEDSWNDRLQSALVGILMSPRFLLIAEGSTGTPKQIDDQELATKLASFCGTDSPTITAS